MKLGRAATGIAPPAVLPASLVLTVGHQGDDLCLLPWMLQIVGRPSLSIMSCWGS